MTVFSVEGKRILVTGAASGIGKAAADMLCQNGAEVIGLDVQPISSNLARKINLDLSSLDSIQDVSQALDGQFDALCNIAGLSMFSPRESVLAVNWVGTKFLTEEILPKIKPNGVVINTASIGGRMWRENLHEVKNCLNLSRFEDIHEFCKKNEVQPQLSYKLTKETLVAWTIKSAASWVPQKVRCNVVSPGIVDTPMLANALASSGERGQRFSKMAPRYCTLEEVAHIYTFLCSDAANALNGIDLQIDAGLGAVLNKEDFSLL